MSDSAMLQTIISMLEKSQSDISSLRAETAALKASNANLERQLSNAILNQNAVPIDRGQTLSPVSPQSTTGLTPPGSFNPLMGTPLISPQSSPRVGPAVGPNVPTRAFQVRPSHDISKFWAVVPAGGSGTRLWPLSRSDFPKFLLDLTGRGRTLIQATWDRLLPLTGKERLMVVTGVRHASPVQSQLPDLLLDNILTEPSAKESAAAIGLAAAVLALRDPENVFGSFAADHFISGADAFEHAVEEAVITAREGHLVTIGIAPSSPATGFGYIKIGERLGIHGAPTARQVLQFKEKPDSKTASKYLARGDYRWNAGMFVCKATVMLDLLKKYSPELHSGLTRLAAILEDKSLSSSKKTEAFKSIWSTLPKIAIDNAVAEPAAAEGKVAVVPATFGWDDVGDYASLAEMLPAEKGGPRVLGDHGLVVTEKVAGGIVVPCTGRTIAILGIDDVVVVDTPDAVLVTSHARSQEVKKLVARCKEAGKGDLL
ncbi:mannose-1-phosphate guanylyltransferase [Atractiella rhizophila]|nr:mannose-1-phosphate guanylyltransferase [Atractiella rhizophila]